MLCTRYTMKSYSNLYWNKMVLFFFNMKLICFPIKAHYLSSVRHIIVFPVDHIVVLSITHQLASVHLHTAKKIRLFLINWIAHYLACLTTKLLNVVRIQHVDLKLSLYGTGNYELCGRWKKDITFLTNVGFQRHSNIMNAYFKSCWTTTLL